MGTGIFQFHGIVNFFKKIQTDIKSHASMAGASNFEPF